MWLRTQVGALGWMVHESDDSFRMVREGKGAKQAANSVAIFQGGRRRSLLPALVSGEVIHHATGTGHVGLAWNDLGGRGGDLCDALRGEVGWPSTKRTGGRVRDL
jgi:hypothetical protein